MGEIEDVETTRLDGNAAAGVLTQVFCGEPSDALIVCAGCGATTAVGALMAYGLELGAILRCPHCDTAVLRLGAAGAMLWLDLRGAVSLRVRVSDSSS
jgi:zinc transporter ZupT